MVDWNTPRPEATTKRLSYEVGMGVLVAISGVMQVVSTQVSWLWVGIGLVTAVLAHAAAKTPPGRWADEWFKRIGIGGRIVVIVIAVFVIWGSIWYFKPPAVIIPSFVTGAACILIGIPLFWLLTRLRSNGRKNPA